MIHSDSTDKPKINPSLLSEWDWIERSNGAYIIRSKFYAQPRTIDEAIEHAFTNADKQNIGMIGALSDLVGNA